MDKNTIIGLVVLFGMFMGWSWWMQPSTEELELQKHKQDSIQLVAQQRIDSLNALQTATIEASNERATLETLKDENEISSEEYSRIDNERLGIFASAARGEHQTFQIENNLLRLSLSTKGGMVYDAELKDYKSYDSIQTHLFDSLTSGYGLEFFSNNRIIDTRELYFVPVFYDNQPQDGVISLRDTQDSLRFGMRLYAGPNSNSSNDKYIEFIYTLKRDSYMNGFEISFNNTRNVVSAGTNFINFKWNSDLTRQEKNLKDERNQSTVYFKFANEGVDYLGETKDDQDIINQSIKWISFKSRFFSSTFIADKSFANAEIRTWTDPAKEKNTHYLESMEAAIGLPYNTNQPENVKMQLYYGPNSYPILTSYNLDLEQQIPIGWGFFLLAWINKGVIWVFGLLSLMHLNYGIIILIMAIIVKTLLFPIAYKSYMSSAKMRVLKPEIEEITAKFPKKDDAMKKQKATMDLYKRVGVNPMSGCLPMVLQMPILFAMFRFFPSSIELRQQSFLWAHDLSSYDSILNLPFNIPFYGDHVSLFTLLMTVSTIFYTKINNELMGSTSNAMPGMKTMMYFMPIMFLGIFNNYASALSYYYLLVNVITFLQMWIFRKAIDEDAIRKKLLSNKKKPAKKSAWQKRMDSMVKQQQVRK